MNATRTVTTPTTNSPVRGARRLATATVMAATMALAPFGGWLATPVHADATVTYDASGNWKAAVHTLAIQTPGGATVNLPLHIYVPGAEHLDGARTAQIAYTARPGARGGTDVEVTVNLPAAGKAFPTNGAVRGLDVPDGEGIFVQRGGNSSRPLVFTFRLQRA